MVSLTGFTELCDDDLFGFRHGVRGTETDEGGQYEGNDRKGNDRRGNGNTFHRWLPCVSVDSCRSGKI